MGRVAAVNGRQGSWPDWCREVGLYEVISALGIDSGRAIRKLSTLLQIRPVTGLIWFQRCPRLKLEACHLPAPATLCRQSCWPRTGPGLRQLFPAAGAREYRSLGRRPV